MKKKYNLLLVNYDYPPVGGVGTQRIYHFAKYLKKAGHNPIVLTTRHGLGKHRDESLLNDEIFLSIPVLRIGGESLVEHHENSLTGVRKYYYYSRLLLMNIWFGQIYYAWFRDCKKQLPNIVKENEIDCVWTTSPSSASLFFGRYIKSNLDTPWIADLRDPLVAHTDWNKGVSSWILEQINKYWEKKICSQADYVVCVSQPMIDNIVKRAGPMVKKGKLRLIPNGYDPEDFDNREGLAKNKKLTFTYTGTFLGRRNPNNLIEAARLLLEHNPSSADKIRFVFAGEYPTTINQSLIELSNLYDCNFTGFVPRDQVTKLQLSADVLLLLTVDQKDRNAQEIITGKVFEYIGANKPILATAVDGPLKKIIIDGRFGLVASPGNSFELYLALQDLYQQWLDDGSVIYNPDTRFSKSYSRQSQTQDLLKLIDSAIHSNDSDQ